MQKQKSLKPLSLACNFNIRTRAVLFILSSTGANIDNIFVMMAIDRPSDSLNETNGTSIYKTMYIFIHNRDTYQQVSRFGPFWSTSIKFEEGAPILVRQSANCLFGSTHNALWSSKLTSFSLMQLISIKNRLSSTVFVDLIEFNSDCLSVMAFIGKYFLSCSPSSAVRIALIHKPYSAASVVRTSVSAAKVLQTALSILRDLHDIGATWLFSPCKNIIYPL